jgi:hypothetical protein
MLLNCVDGSPEFRIGLGHAHAIQHKSNGANIEPLQSRSRVSNLCARRHSRLDNHNRAIGKSHKVLCFG